MDANTWSSILEPVRGGNSSGGTVPSSSSSATHSDEKDTDNAREPRPRLGHSVVYDPSRQTFYTFGGNNGNGMRVNDFWSLTLNRYVFRSTFDHLAIYNIRSYSPTIEDVIRKGKLCVRSEK